MQTSTPKLKIVAPLSGVLVPLEQVPDPVFAQRMVGDGVSIDPLSSELLSPIDGTVSQLHESRHAVAVTGPEGHEILVHIGVDTVGLRGAGFTALVKKGERVKTGQPLLRFDQDLVGHKARSLLTQVLLANSENYLLSAVRGGMVTAGVEVLFEVEKAAPGAAAFTQAGSSAGTQETAVSGPVVLRNALGLHARPAAVLAGKAKQLLSEIWLVRGAEEVNAKSMVAIMGLSTRFGDTVQVKASGPDAKDAVFMLEALLKEGCGEALADKAAEMPAKQVTKPGKAAGNGRFVGECASPGLVLGTLVLHRGEEFEVVEKAPDAAAERARLKAALFGAGNELSDPAKGAGEAGKIRAAHRELLNDPHLLEASLRGIEAGESAAFAWLAAFTEQAGLLQRLDNPALQERAVDIRDVGRRVLRLLCGGSSRKSFLPAKSILLAEEITPSEFGELDAENLAGLCLVKGGVSGHVAILAKAMGLPFVCGMPADLLLLPEGGAAILDADAGLLNPRPSEAEITDLRVRLNQLEASRRQDLSSAHEPALTSDGHRVEVVANVRHAGDITKALAQGAEGVGLLRSEFLFEGRSEPPLEEDHLEAALAAARALGKERPLVIRTLDVGGDKAPSYLPLPHEENPFLGVRGIRVSLERPELFRAQLRGLLRAASECNLHIMFPMISTVSEFRQAKAIAEEEMQATGQRAKIGVMIEVPSAALMADALAREADFFSIGTNDLMQYVLAMDRGHARLAKVADTLEPAVLRMIGMAVEAAHRHGKWVGVCGGAASDPKAVPLLLGLGVDELSVSPVAIPAIKAQVRGLSLAACRILAESALALATAAEVRALCDNLYPKA